MRARRRLAAVVAGILVAVALTGCETAGSLVDEARIGVALSELQSEVEAIDGVVLSYSEPELQGDYSYRVSLAMTATGSANDAGVRQAMLAAHSTLADTVFAANPARLSLDAGDRGQVHFEGSSHDELQFVNEIDYWLAVAHLVESPVSLSLGISDGVGRYEGMAVVRPVDADTVIAIAQIPAPQGGDRSWSMPGLEAFYTLPDEAGLALFGRLGEILPRVDYWSGPNARGALMYWNGDGRVGVTVVLAGQEPSTITQSEDWPLVLEALRAVIASGLPATFTVQPDESIGGVNVRWGHCDKPYENPEIDAAFLSLLQPYGLPADAVAGGC